MVHPRKVACSVTAIALSSMLVFPSAAFGATYVNVDGSEHTSAASGKGWSWDGGDNMTLTDYRGGSIIAEGDLILNLVGENIVVASSSSDAGVEVNRNANGDSASAETATLDIVGKGSLEVKGNDVGIYSEDDMTIEDTTVFAYGEETGIGTNGVLEIDGSTVGAMADSSAYDGTVRGLYASGLNIEDSSVEVISKSLSGGAAADGKYIAGIEVDGGTGTSINIENSTVRASAISTRSGDSLTGIANLAEGGTIQVDDTVLTVYVSGSEDLEDGVGIYVSDGDLVVSDSDLSVTALGGAARGVSAQVVDSAGVKVAPEVTFANSNVNIEAAGPAVTSIYYGGESEDASLERMGKVVLVNSVISLGGQVQDILFELGEDGADVWAAGQSIGDDADLASKVTIEALGDGSGADVPAVPDGSGDSDTTAAGSGGIAQTGDDAASFGIMAAFAAIAAAFAGFIAATRRRFDSAAK